MPVSPNIPAAPIGATMKPANSGTANWEILFAVSRSDSAVPRAAGGAISSVIPMELVSATPKPKPATTIDSAIAQSGSGKANRSNPAPPKTADASINRSRPTRRTARLKMSREIIEATARRLRSRPIAAGAMPRSSPSTGMNASSRSWAVTQTLPVRTIQGNPRVNAIWRKGIALPFPFRFRSGTTRSNANGGDE